MFTGLNTWLLLHRTRRERLARFERVRTSEDRVMLRRMEALGFGLFLAVIVVPAVALFVDHLAGVDFATRVLMAVVEAAR